MPYKLKISTEEVERELESMGFTDVSEDVVENLRKGRLNTL